MLPANALDFSKNQTYNNDEDDILQICVGTGFFTLTVGIIFALGAGCLRHTLCAENMAVGCRWEGSDFISTVQISAIDAELRSFSNHRSCRFEEISRYNGWLTKGARYILQS